MEDRLVWLLNHFELRASVFQAGPLTGCAAAPERADAGTLHLLQAGGVRIEPARGAATEIREPSAFFFMGPAAHRLVPLDEAASLVCATFEFGLGRGNPLQAALPELVVVPLADAPTLGATLKQLFEEAAGDHCGRDAILDRLCEVALILLLRDLMDRKRLDIGLLAGLADPKLARAINRIHASPDDEWTLEKMAGAAAMSRARFADRFHKVVGMPPGAYLSEWRLGLAKSKLLKGLPVQTVARDVGYGSASALSRVFSNRVGMAPTEWRRSVQDGGASA